MCPQSEEEQEVMKSIPYQQAIGSLLFAAQVSRPDISFAVNTLSQFNHNPGKAHWIAVKRVFRYLKGSTDVKLEFDKNKDNKIIGFCDADWASNVDDRRSVTGYLFVHCGGPISWTSKRQPTVALSTMEAEYMAMSFAVQEAMWIRALAKEFNIETNCPEEAIHVFCDSQSAISLASTSAYHAKSKHIDVKYHFVREKINDKIVKLNYINTKEMPADFLTKSLNLKKFKNCCELSGLTLK
jgi:hypothetical protein